MKHREYDVKELKKQILTTSYEISKTMRDLRDECHGSGELMCVVISVPDDLIDGWSNWGDIVPSMSIVEMADRVVIRSLRRERSVKDRGHGVSVDTKRGAVRGSPLWDVDQ